MSLRIDGTLLVKKISSRNGPFCIGELHTDIGEFKVKDSIIDQFKEGRYAGKFWISQIYPHSYFAFGKVIIEIRAKLADVQIDDEAALQKDSETAQEIDPAREETAVKPMAKPDPVAPLKPAPVKAISLPQSKVSTEPPVAKPERASSTSQAPTEVATTDDAADLELFGEELFELVKNKQTVKLDSTIDDRLKFRGQITRLRDFGYGFKSKTQSWELPTN